MFQFVKFQNENVQEWENFNVLHEGTFLTSHYWIELQEQLDKNVDRYFIVKNETLKGILYVEVYRRKLSKYAYAPYSPVIDKSILENESELIEFFSAFKNFQNDYISNNGLNLFRFDPYWDAKFSEVLKKQGFKNSLAPTQAKVTWIIDLSQDEELLLANMKKVARYNIRSSEKFGIKVSKIQSRSEVEKFYSILSETQSKKNFSTHSIDYFFKQYDQLYAHSMMDIYFAMYQDKVISTALINKYNETGSYTHGGSINSKEFQKYGASYLLHWEIMKDLKKQGFNSYNMWGVLPEGINNQMSGVSDFKKRFGGETLNLVGGFELRGNGLRTTIQTIMEYFVYKKERY